ncbi:MAG: DUF554 domain-containing protein [Salinispira sp.]
MLASIINAAAVCIGAVFGTFFQTLITTRKDIQSIIYHAIGLIACIIGIMMSIHTQRILYFALATVLGAVIGQVVGIEAAIKNIGVVLQRLLTGRAGKVAESTAIPHAFLDASILFCVGSLSIIGSLQAGTEGNFSILLTKSVLDGTVAVLLSAALGPGVALAAITIIVYQGGLTLVAGSLAPYMTPLMISEISAVGGIMMLGIGISLLGLKKIASGNFLPALHLVIVFVLLDPHLPEFLKG